MLPFLSEKNSNLPLFLRPFANGEMMDRTGDDGESPELSHELGGLEPPGIDPPLPVLDMLLVRSLSIDISRPGGAWSGIEVGGEF